MPGHRGHRRRKCLAAALSGLSAACGSAAATALAAVNLYWRAGYRAIGTEDTAVSWQRLEQRAASLAVVEILTRIGGHDFVGDLTAERTRQRRLQDRRGIKHSDSQAIGGRRRRAGRRRSRRAASPAVSYTHLDVYKRQADCSKRDQQREKAAGGGHWPYCPGTVDSSRNSVRALRRIS